ncbi:hypothetical protein Hanom_Chr11g01004161 [Helianthus anomalus]
MHIEPTVNRFQVFYQLYCSQGFYYFAQRSSAKKILLVPPKSFHEHCGRNYEDIWYQDLKDVPSIELPKRALADAGMSLHWKMDREDKSVYMEDDRSKIWDSPTFLFSKGKMTTIPKGAGEELKKRVPALIIAPKKTNAPKAQSSKAKNVREEKKGKRRFTDSWCDYIVVSNILEGLAPVVLRKQKVEPRDTADIPTSNPNDPIDLESSPEPLLRTKAVKRK